MASFEARVEAITGIAIESSGTTPLQSELTEFLQLAVTEVVNAIITARPSEAMRFATTSNSTSSIAQTGKILSVVREHDSTSILRSCEKIPTNLRYEATDSESLHFKTKTNPGYYLLAGNIHTVPSAASGNNDIVVTQVVYDTGLEFSDSAIDNFPPRYESLVTISAAIKCLEAKMATYIHTDEDVELANAIGANIASLKSQYATMLPRAQAAPQQGARR